MKLFFIIAGDEINNQDLFVNAETHPEAVAHWRSYFDTEADEEPTRVFEIQTNGISGALGWQQPDDGGVVVEYDL